MRALLPVRPRAGPGGAVAAERREPMLLPICCLVTSSNQEVTK